MENNSDIEKAAKAYINKRYSNHVFNNKSTVLLIKHAYIQGRLDEKAVLPDLSDMYNEAYDKYLNAKTRAGELEWNGQCIMLKRLKLKGIISLNKIQE